MSEQRVAMGSHGEDDVQMQRVGHEVPLASFAGERLSVGVEREHVPVTEDWEHALANVLLKGWIAGEFGKLLSESGYPHGSPGHTPM
jgi:hypothetical protein